MELDHDTATVRMDWHGYAVDQVETWADKLVEAAWANGFEYVEFVHGAGDVAARGMPGYSGAVSGRGRIKEVLRQRFFRGRWNKWARTRAEGMHRIEESRLIVALKENSEPAARPWPLIPPPAY
jgi:hypothetical protein